MSKAFKRIMLLILLVVDDRSEERRGRGRHQTARGFRRGCPAVHHPPLDLVETSSAGHRRGPGPGVVGGFGGGVRAAERRDRARIRVGERGRRSRQGDQRLTVQPAWGGHRVPPEPGGYRPGRQGGRRCDAFPR